MLRKSY